MTSNPEKLPLEMKQVALNDMVTLTMKLCHQTSLVSYSTENRSKMSFRKETSRFEVFMEHFPRSVESALTTVSKY